MQHLITVILVSFVLVSYVCAKVAQYITKKTWPGLLVMFFSIVPLFSIYLRSLFRNFNSSVVDNLVTFVCDFSYVYIGFILYLSIYIGIVFLIYSFYRKLNLRKFFVAGFVVVPVFLFGAYINAVTPRLNVLDIESNSRLNLKVCFVSDIHVGSIGTNHIIDTVIECIKDAKPDVVIVGGDVLDIGLLDAQLFQEKFKKITSKYKTYAVVGNHEVYANINKCIKILKQTGIEVLLDQSVSIKGFTIAGRLDKTIQQKKKLSEIVSKDVKNLIVVDHSPFRSYIQESIDHKALIHLSGHTHAGQMFPMNLVVNYLFGSSCSLKKVNDTNIYISCGAGFWGPPYRIGNIPEVVLININANN